MKRKEPPSLFGLSNTNKDFSNQDNWGKNQFNNIFPAALACYMASSGIDPVFICIGEDQTSIKRYITISDLFGMSYNSPDLHFFFEGQFSPYATMAIGNLEGIDLVTSNRVSHQQLSALEIKLTAVPDHTTSELPIENQGAEIVIRPQTISYLALSIANLFQNSNDRYFLNTLLEPIAQNITDWSEPDNIRPQIGNMVDALKTLTAAKLDKQTPLLLQTIWRTEGTSNILSENCFDIFVWSNFGLIDLFAKSALLSPMNRITRQTRSVCWLIKMLYDFSVSERINPRAIQDELTYNTRNDKAFAVSGVITNQMMRCNELVCPRISKSAIKDIILGGGQKLLKPERRLDASILSTPGLFD